MPSENKFWDFHTQLRFKCQSWISECRIQIMILQKLQFVFIWKDRDRQCHPLYGRVASMESYPTDTLRRPGHNEARSACHPHPESASAATPRSSWRRKAGS